MFDITKVNWKKVGIFASGVLFGTAGIKALSSKDAKNVYTNCTAAVLRAKDCVMKTATNIQENAEDIYAEAKNINEERAAEMEEFSLPHDCRYGECLRSHDVYSPGGSV